MGEIEFFTSGEDVWYSSAEGIKPLTEGSDIIPIIIERIQALYPKAYEALVECYSRSAANVTYFNYLIVRRFCKCNFGVLDYTRTDATERQMNIECISCPLRGECKYEGVICMPKMETKLSDSEKRVMRLVCEGRSNEQIAEELFLSPNTIRRHISNSYDKTGVRNRAEFVKYAKDNNLFV